MIPHLTVWFEKLRPRLRSQPEGEPAGLAEQLERCLPIHASATQVDLLAIGPTWRWSLRASFPFGGGEPEWVSAEG